MNLSIDSEVHPRLPMGVISTCGRRECPVDRRLHRIES
jgi:hypothetical protein